MKPWLAYISILIGLFVHGQNTPRNWVDTVTQYSDSYGNTLEITNSLPKGGGTYLDTNENTYSYVIFRHKVTNTSEVPMELTMEFPSESLKIFASQESFIRLFFPNETMTSEKIGLTDYGLSDLEGLLDDQFHKPSKLEKTINPKEEYLFYVATLLYKARGTARAALIPKDGKVSYLLRIHPDSASIPSGRITFEH
ncbi:hypothetical protein NYZ99_09095 [Maribacter litopenaei]|uniref:Uncharacterized protein n=1 Tax=Maribacter litopenaei TaxID=2976127 RepID=A0ABY5YBA0_9FLAO|nr:hypothetical protein [Maribacter litopenaei]UWX56333.1 hypothetical protein NYZ99_09095 [Maribacter litopenaei]